MLEDDDTSMVTTTLMFEICEKALMNELEKLKSPCKQWFDHQFLFTLWAPIDFVYPNGLLVDEQHDPSIDWNVRSEDEF